MAVFLSLSGDDRKAARELCHALTKLGVPVFLDEKDIPFGHDITAEIQEALRSAKVLLCYYSPSFADRAACQYELHHAYLAASRAGEVRERILVVNPADPDTDHLLPLELATHRYWRRWSTDAELRDTARQIAAVVNSVSTPFTGLNFDARPRPTATTAPTPNATFVGRYRDEWALHEALHAGDHPLTAGRRSTVSAVALTGLSGMGKTALVGAYEYDFGFRYPGGVYRLSLAAATAETDIGSVHTEQLIRLAESAGEAVPNRARESVLAWWANRLDLGADALWIVDDVPATTSDRMLAELVPAARGVYPVLIGQREMPAHIAHPVRLGGLSEEDGRALFAKHHQVGPEDQDAVDQVVAGLGGHPFAIALAAGNAHGREGLWQLRERVGHLTGDPAVLAAALRTVRATITTLPAPERIVLAIAAVCSPGPLPAVFVRDVLGARLPAHRDRANEVLAGLERAMLAERHADTWQMHQLVREAAKLDTDAAELDTVAAIAAHTVITLAERGTPGLVEHGVALLDRVSGTPTYATALNALAAAHHDARGEPAPAARFHEELATLHPDDRAHLLAAAGARQQAGYPMEAHAHLDRLSGLDLDDATALRSAAIRAAVLGDQGRHHEAELLWTRVVDELPRTELGRVEMVALRTGHLRNQRMLGHYLHARSLLSALLAEYGDMGDDVLVPARLEQIEIDLVTDDRKGARRAAQELVAYYERLGMPRHVNAISASVALQRARLNIFIMEKFPTMAELEEAEKAVRVELTDARRDFGADNPRTIVTEVAHLESLIRSSQPQRAVDEYRDLPDRIAATLGPAHDRRFRALFLLGWGFGTLGDNDEAARRYRAARDGQLMSLGPGHPDTLESIYEFAVCQWRDGDRAAATEAFQTVRESAADKIGRRNDLYGKALTASLLSSFLPSPVFRALERFGNRQKPGN